MKFKNINKHKQAILVFTTVFVQFIYISYIINNDNDYKYVLENTMNSNIEVWCELVRVVDGDTIMVIYNNEETKVRLIGIDTPESVHSDQSKNTTEGIIASNYTKKLLQDVNKVGLEFDVDKFDIYNRLLAYVYLEDGTMLNYHLLENGYAQIMTYPPNTKHLKYFESIGK